MKPGKVYLVGAGPGDPGLITVRGLHCLAQADLVLYDGLVNPLLLAHTHAHAERTNRCKSPGGASLNQHEINERLISAAREGKTVVRLKGGDPFVFGRGGEEAAALAGAEIPFEVVPGVTAAVAASAYAGISLTHRDQASAVAFVTGHEDPHKAGSLLDYGVLAVFPGTLVFYMGLHRLPAIAAALIAAGKPEDTPAAVISRGTTPAQKTATGTLAELPRLAADAGLHAPSMIIIGDCIRQRDTIGWFEKKPLFGQRVLIARPLAQSSSVVSRLLELGAQPVVAPVIEILPPLEWSTVDPVLARLREYDWIAFTSVNGVRFLFDRLWETGGDARRLGRAKLAAIGDGTAQALAEIRLQADLIPESFRAEALAAALAPQVAGKRVLWARASRGRDVLPAQLRAAGAQLDEIVVYRHIDVDHFEPETAAALEAGEVDWICLSSPSIARSVNRLLTPAARARLGSPIRIASISPVTTAAARECGLPIDAEASIYTWDGLLDALMSNASAPRAL
ncbi:MAG: uroporphyrinogen-III C-methyltransferase [Planctomycetia bacterium]|nr:uroporphyrinogen-III C-methyltransferase [Planctomycetia bacterium]